jgi:transposase InsO family protein
LNCFYRAIGISKQAAHKQLANHYQIKDEQMQLLKVIYDVRKDHPTMGMRDLYYKLQPATMGRDRFERFCKCNNLWSLQPTNYRRTTNSSGVIRYSNLLETMNISSINQVWQSDITYYDLHGKFYYITFIIDSYSRRIVGHHTSNRLLTEETTLPALKMALQIRRGIDLDGLVFHSDGGGQYYDKAFIELTKKEGFKNSMCEYAWENGKAERINGVIKNNYLKHRAIKTSSELINEVDRSVSLYNKEKPHKALQRKSPVVFEYELVTCNSKQSRR